jgi:hypothetical protein
MEVKTLSNYTILLGKKYENEILPEETYIILNDELELEAVQGEFLDDTSRSHIIARLVKDVVVLGGAEWGLTIFKGDDGKYYALTTSATNVCAVGQYDCLSVEDLEELERENYG